MKISPIAQGSGTPGQTLGSVDIGKTADAQKMERARAIARGEVPQETTGNPQADKALQNVRSIRMQTNRTINRELPPEQVTEETVDTTQSTISDTTEEPAVEVTQPLSPQFAALAKQKRALQVKEKELADREKALGSGAPMKEAEELKARIKANPLSVLQENGVTYDQLTEAILSDQSNPDIQALKDEIKALKGDVEKSFVTREEQAEEAALTEILYEAEDLSKEGEAYEMIRATGQSAYDKVLRNIYDEYKKTGRVPSTSKIMDKVENELLADAERLASIGKVRSKLAPPPAPPLQSQPQRQMRTLTARDTASPQMDRKARAIAAMNGTLKK